MQGVFGKDDEVHRRHPSARLLHHRANLLCLRRQIALGDDRRQLQLNEPDDHTVGSLVQSTEPTHWHFSLLTSAPGRPKLTPFLAGSTALFSGRATTSTCAAQTWNDPATARIQRARGWGDVARQQFGPSPPFPVLVERVGLLAGQVRIVELVPDDWPLGHRRHPARGAIPVELLESRFFQRACASGRQCSLEPGRHLRTACLPQHRVVGGLGMGPDDDPAQMAPVAHDEYPGQLVVAGSLPAPRIRRTANTRTPNIVSPTMPKLPPTRRSIWRLDLSTPH